MVLQQKKNKIDIIYLCKHGVRGRHFFGFQILVYIREKINFEESTFTLKSMIESEKYDLLIKTFDALKVCYNRKMLYL